MRSIAALEAERLEELDSLRLIGTAASREFDAVTSHLQALFGVEKCSIALIAGDRLWFKSRIGIAVADAPREGSFADHTIRSTEVMVVEDATKDPRFRDFPIVIDKPGIRFYAGAPLIIRDDLAIGSLAVMDRKPRVVTPAERVALASMAEVVVALIKVHRLAAESEARRRSLEIREAQFKQTETIARLGGWEWELATNRVTWSDEVYRIHDMPVGQPIIVEEAMSVYPENERPRIEELIQRCMTERTTFSEVFRIVSLKGTPKWMHIAGDVEVVDDQVVRLFGISQDVTESHEVKRRLLEAASTDALTGLANRSRFTTQLEERFGQSTKRLFALLMIDVDHLKDVNDTLGHDAGDVLIRTVAERLQRCAGINDIVARLGGDEFAIITELAPSAGTPIEISRRIVAAMGERITFGGRTLSPQVSIGFAVPNTHDTPDTLRQKADIALYHAKDVRRGGFVAFAETLRSTMATRIEMSRQLDEALDDNRVVPHYQPIVNLRTGRIEGVEALARIRMPDGGLRSAGEFSTAMDDCKNAVRLTCAMLRAVCVDLASWRDRGLSVGRVGINATTADFRGGELDKRILAAFTAANLPLSQVTIEVTETVFLSQVAGEVARTLTALREHGARVALDDFGTGHASLANLGTLPVDVIKIDRSFVSRMGSHKVSEAIVKSLIDLGDVLNIAVVAEGIESDEQLLRLQRMGCNAGQGYLFSRPLAAPDLADFIEAFGQTMPVPQGRGQIHFVA